MNFSKDGQGKILQHWKHERAGLLDCYIVGNPRASTAIIDVAFHQNASGWLWDALCLSCADDANEMHHFVRAMLEQAIILAEEDWRTERFSETSFADPEIAEKSRLAYGRGNTLRTLHYAYWLRSGEFSPERLRQAIPYLIEYRYVCFGRYLDGDSASISARKDAVELLLPYMIEVEDYSQAIEWYEKYYPIHLSVPPMGNAWLRDPQQVLYFVALYAMGNVTLADYVRKGIVHWYAQAQKWYQRENYMPPWSRWQWAWFHAKYVTGVTDTPSIIRGLRGY